MHKGSANENLYHPQAYQTLVLRCLHWGVHRQKQRAWDAQIPKEKDQSSNGDVAQATRAPNHIQEGR